MPRPCHQLLLAFLLVMPGLPTLTAGSPGEIELPTVAEGFAITRVAETQLIVEVSAMAWGDRGQLWLAGRAAKAAASGEYLIVQLNDRDFDGQMDQHEVCAALKAPVSALLAHGDGLLMASGEDILWLQNASGTARMEEPSVLYTGFGTGEPQDGIVDLTWGMDGWVWAVQGSCGKRSLQITSPYHDALHAHIDDEPLARYGQVPPGLLRLQVDGDAIEPIAVFNEAAGGLALSSRGELFFSVGTPARVAHLLISEEHLGASRLPGARTWNSIGSAHSTTSRAAGFEVYNGGGWPFEFEGNAFVCFPEAGRVERHIVKRDGPGYGATRKLEGLAHGARTLFIPLDIQTGPDGALYVLDAGPAGPARVWRIQHNQATRADERNLPLQLALDRRQLAGNSEAAGQLERDSANAYARTLWRAYQAMEEPGDAVRLAMGLEIALANENSSVRRHAALIAGELGDDPNAHNLLAYLCEAVADRDPRVVLAALQALKEFSLDAPSRKRILDGSRTLTSPESFTLLLQLARREPLEFFDASLQSVLAAATRAPTRSQTLLLETLVSELSEAELAARLEPLASAAARGEGALVALHGVRLSTPANSERRAALAGDGERILVLLQDDERPLDLRLAALHALLQDPERGSAALLVASDLLNPAHSPRTQARVLRELNASQLSGSGQVLARSLLHLTPQLRQEWTTQLTRTDGPINGQTEWLTELLRLLEQGDLKPADLPPGMHSLLIKRTEGEIAARVVAQLEQHADEDGPTTAAWITDNLEALLAPADRRRGQRLFQVNCAPCHRHTGNPAGLPVGPDVANFPHTNRRDLLQRILQPQRTLDPAYLEYSATLRNGRTVRGRVSHEDDSALTLTGTGGVRRLHRSDITRLESSGKSPMPSGFRALGAEGLRDLLEYLAPRKAD